VFDLTIPQQILDEMIAEARAAAPHECCGMLAGRGQQVTHHYKIKNIVAAKSEAVKQMFDNAKIAHLEQLSAEERADIAFWMDDKEMFAAQKDMRKQDIALLASYHSHPVSPARPSPTDIKALAFYPDIVHIIVSLMDEAQPVANAFRIVEGTVTQVSFQII
jgi:[CysO sulfur-carrier protein]-S-L-cysteine hydrolase